MSVLFRRECFGSADLVYLTHVSGKLSSFSYVCMKTLSFEIVVFLFTYFLFVCFFSSLCLYGSDVFPEFCIKRGKNNEFFQTASCCLSSII